MATSRDEIKNKLEAETLDGLAVMAKQAWPVIQIVVNKAAPEGFTLTLSSDEKKQNEEIRAYVKQLHKDGKITIKDKDGKEATVTLEQMDTLLASTADGDPILGKVKVQLGGKPLSSLIPRAKDVDAITDAVYTPAERHEREYKEKTFFDKIMEYIAGFFAWVMSGFEGGFDGLQKTIALQFINPLTDEVDRNLGNVMAKNPAVANMLAGGKREKLLQEVEHNALVAAEVAQPKTNEDTKTKLEDVQMGDLTAIAKQEIARQGVIIKQETYEALEKGRNTEREKLAKFVPDWLPLSEHPKGWISKGFTPDDTKLKSIATSISKTVVDTLQNPADLKNKKDDEAKKAILDKIIENLKKDKHEDFLKFEFEENGQKITMEAKLRAEMEAKINDKWKEIKPVIDLLNNPPISGSAKKAADEVEKHNVKLTPENATDMPLSFVAGKTTTSYRLPGT